MLTVVGAAVIVAYGVLGALLMTRWELAAGSGLPPEETIARIEAAGESFSEAPGVFFAVVGVLAALAWAAATLARATRGSGLGSLAAWGVIVALGAPSYFFWSFPNMMSVGDTFDPWHPDAAFALVSPLYVVSSIGALIGMAAVVAGVIRSPRGELHRSPRPRVD